MKPKQITILLIVTLMLFEELSLGFSYLLFLGQRDWSIDAGVLNFNCDLVELIAAYPIIFSGKSSREKVLLELSKSKPNRE